jgi:hypothetical protein
MASFMDELRAFDEHLRAHGTKVLAVAGSGGRLGVRYRPPADRDDLTPVLVAMNTEGALSEDEELQLLVDCCDAVLRWDDEKGDLVPDGGEEDPLRFDASDPRWGGGPETARDCVRELFKLKRQPLAASRHVGSLIDWLQGSEAERTARVEGKSASAEG